METLRNYCQEVWGLSDSSHIRWAHAANNRVEYDVARNDPNVHIIEVDVIVDGAGTAVLGHPPAKTGDPVQGFLEEMLESEQGVKVDFKSWQAVSQVLEMLNRLQLSQLVILNADILQGNAANAPAVPAERFIDVCQQQFPAGLLSLGWTTRRRKPYTARNVDEMLSVVADLEEVLFPIRTSLARRSWQQLERLIPDDKPGWGLSLWNTVSEVPRRRNIDWIVQRTDGRAVYDFMDKAKTPIVVKR